MSPCYKLESNNGSASSAVAPINESKSGREMRSLLGEITSFNTSEFDIVSLTTRNLGLAADLQLFGLPRVALALLPIDGWGPYLGHHLDLYPVLDGPP